MSNTFNQSSAANLGYFSFNYYIYVWVDGTLPLPEHRLIGKLEVFTNGFKICGHSAITLRRIFEDTAELIDRTSLQFDILFDNRFGLEFESDSIFAPSSKRDLIKQCDANKFSQVYLGEYYKKTGLKPIDSNCCSFLIVDFIKPFCDRALNAIRGGQNIMPSGINVWGLYLTAVPEGPEIWATCVQD